MPKRVMTEERRQQLRENLAKARLAKEAKAGQVHAIENAEETEDVRVVSGQESRRERLLQGIAPDIAALISDDELDRIEREEREKAEAERKKKALDDVRAQMRQRARVENDLIAPDVIRSAEEKRRLGEMVTFKVNLPNDGSGHYGRNGFRVDGRLYQQGAVYTEPRAVFESLQANFFQTWKSELMFKTLDQQKPGNDVRATIGNTIPQFEIVR